eukprot:TRINITY_DN5472_c0_g1_i1.p1 TRINITY_DN5472_c0_g1~~TRINITY_DN5472_c0_g1_i1.p1  ORF type:complete len:613 (-),score=118.59 TRINITY_DN5472_c0_g1_i1:30-1817(-)
MGNKTSKRSRGESSTSAQPSSLPAVLPVPQQTTPDANDGVTPHPSPEEDIKEQSPSSPPLISVGSGGLIAAPLGRRRSSASIRGLDVALNTLEDILHEPNIAGTVAENRLRQVIEIISQSKAELVDGRNGASGGSGGAISDKREVKSGEDNEVASWLRSGFLNASQLVPKDDQKQAQDDPRAQAAKDRWHAVLQGVIKQRKATGGRSTNAGGNDRSITENSVNQSSPLHDGRSEMSLSVIEPEYASKEDVAKVASLTRSITNVCLSKVNSWNEFDVFLLDDLTNGQPLTHLAYFLFEHSGLFDKLDISKTTFLNCFQSIEEGYLDVPYHNRVHAADVMANTYYFILSKPLAALLTRIDLLGSLVAAAIHDFRHPGTNNIFSVSTGDDLAVTYNDRSVLENMHTAEAFRLFKKKHHDIFHSLPKEERSEVRRTIISMVLATDMSQHLKYSSELEASIKAKKENGVWFKTDVYEDRLVCLNMALHVGDLGNPAKPLRIYLEWTDRVVEEFFRQGDQEKALGLPISPMMNREKPNVEKSQIGFIDYVINPLFKLWSQLIPEESQCCMDNIKFNRQHWESQLASTTNAQPNSPEEKHNH